MQREAASSERHPRIFELARAHDVKLVHLAAHCDVDQSTMWRWAKGLSAPPDEKKLQLAAYFGVSVSYLMAWDETPDPAPLGEAA